MIRMRPCSARRAEAAMDCAAEPGDLISGI
jgi:hypothetical protein